MTHRPLDPRADFRLLNEQPDPSIEPEPVHPLATYAVGVFVLFCFLTFIGSF